MRQNLTRLFIGLTISCLGLVGVASPSIAEPECREYNDRGVCLIYVEIPGDDSPAPAPPSGSTKDSEPRYPECPMDKDLLFEGEHPVPDGWILITCTGNDVIGEGLHRVWVEPNVDPERLARSLLAQVGLKPIDIGLVPRGNNVMTVVGMPVWLWVDGPSRTTWGPATISAGGMTLTAKVQSVTWDMGDGTTLTCGKGTEWKKGMGGDPSPTCGHTYDDQGRYTITARSHWLARWSGYGQSGTIPVTLTISRVLEVGEIQVIGTGR
ncbi:MAG TPA: hypothetical protein VGK53_03140 [Propionicimonas sp.]